eukprot:TRINITY_DN85207_c0_g1_i1.p1 TRINITY_DN85207_c0_g1~~TRINITY_DN85207_c0_g1_i1.p1  ORF type:complete len:405 (-),score=195.90 TRINITY_DN85207_c0_g1_i1:41-1255(-)
MKPSTRRLRRLMRVDGEDASDDEHNRRVAVEHSQDANVDASHDDKEADGDEEDVKRQREQNRRNKKVVRIVAPMVRYSKLPFRLLCRENGCDVAFTPMIIAESFNRSQMARDSEFSTTQPLARADDADDTAATTIRKPRLDSPLVVQFATNSPVEFGSAARKVVGYAEAVDLNCGCPQRWTVKRGIGASMVNKPELIKQMVWEARKQTGPHDMAVSVKIRLHKKDAASYESSHKHARHTIDVVQQAERAGASWVSVHGRNVHERRTPVHYDMIKLIKDAATVPIVANGDVFDMDEFDHVADITGVDGIMCARGILANPAMFNGSKRTPPAVIARYLELAMLYGGQFPIHHHHLMYMMYPQLGRVDRRRFSTLRSMAGVIDFLQQTIFDPFVNQSVNQSIDQSIN